MKKITFYSILLSVFSFYSCNSVDSEKKQVETYKEVEVSGEEVLEGTVELKKDARRIGPEKSAIQLQIEKNQSQINIDSNALYGYWVGMFGKNKINIALYNISNDSIFGHSICAGNYRPIKGIVKENEDHTFAITMKEPGDDKYDGLFDFTIDLDNNVLKGKWAPYKKTTKPKTYELKKRDFVYDPKIGNDKGSFGSSRYLQVPDVENMLKEEIELERNRIYARHGYSFDKLKIRRVFEAQDWYIPMSIDIRDELTEIEVSNIDLLYNYEDYIEEYYNEYGR